MKTCKLKANRKITSANILDTLTASDKFAEREVGSYVNSFVCGDHKITVYTSECFYARIDSTLTVILIIDEGTYETTVDIISTGGKAGFALISFGAEKSALNNVLSSLKQMGFEIIR